MSRQRELFKQIKETKLTEIPVQTFLDYAGYNRGLKTFIKMIERENKIIPRDFDESSNSIWNTQTDYVTTGLEMLMYVIGCMKTSSSESALVNFATGDYHPYVQCEAMYGLLGCKDFQRVREIAQQKLRSTRHPVDVYSGILFYENCSYAIRNDDMVREMALLLKHPLLSIRCFAAHALSKKKKGRAFLAEYRKGLSLDDPSSLDTKLANHIDEILKADG